MLWGRVGLGPREVPKSVAVSRVLGAAPGKVDFINRIEDRRIEFGMETLLTLLRLKPFQLAASYTKSARFSMVWGAVGGGWAPFTTPVQPLVTGNW